MPGKPSPGMMRVKPMRTASTERDEFAQHIRLLFSTLHLLCTRGLGGHRAIAYTNNNAVNGGHSADTLCLHWQLVLQYELVLVFPWLAC